MKYSDAAHRYGSPRDQELTKLDGDWWFYGFWFVMFTAATIRLWWWVIAAQRC
jgi:hypothetical protein